MEQIETTTTLDTSGQEKRAWERRAATMAARLMWCCLGIEAEPGFDITRGRGAGDAKIEAPHYGIGLFKDALDFSADGEEIQLQLFIADENGLIKAASKRWFPLGHALDLLSRLPLPVAPQASQWLKDALGESGPTAGRASQASEASTTMPIQKEVGMP
jgi:hypothetical protein